MSGGNGDVRRDKKRRRKDRIGEVDDFFPNHGVPAIDLDDFDVAPDVIALIPGEVARKLSAIPVDHSGMSLIVAMADPSNTFAIDDLKSVTGSNIEVVFAPSDAIQRAIDRYHGG